MPPPTLPDAREPLPEPYYGSNALAFAYIEKEHQFYVLEFGFVEPDLDTPDLAYLEALL